MSSRLSLGVGDRLELHRRIQHYRSQTGTLDDATLGSRHDRVGQQPLAASLVGALAPPNQTRRIVLQLMWEVPRAAEVLPVQALTPVPVEQLSELDRLLAVVGQI